MNKDTIEQLIRDTDEDINYVEKIAKDIVKSRTKDLDDIMQEINQKVVSVSEPSDEILEQYFLELTNAIYFISSHCEYLGFYEDISKNNAKLAYNNAYSDNQIRNAASNVKATVAENQIRAENASINETLVSLIYSRSYRIIKVKLDAANEMVKTLSKLISSRMQDKQLSGLAPNQAY